MKQYLRNYLTKLYEMYSFRFLPRWLVLLFDLAVIFFTFYTAYAIRLNFQLESLNVDKETPQAIFVTLVYLASFQWYRSYSGIIRHTGLNDAYRIFQATATAFVILFIIGLIARSGLITVPWTNSFAALLIHFLLSYFILMGFRIVVKTVFSRLIRSPREHRQNVIIYGAGSAGIITRNALVSDPRTKYDIIAFADDNPNKANKMIEGVPVMLPLEVLNVDFIRKNEVGMLIIALQKIEPVRKAEIIELAIEYGLEVKDIPPIESWINGQLNSTQLREVRIEQLLEREQISLDKDHIIKEVFDKIVMVTGAAGSIGSEIVRQLLSYQPSRLLMVDQAESALFDLMFDLNANKEHKKHVSLAYPIIADVNDFVRMKRLFELYKPEIVFHASAYKHVPLMEENPYEAILVNIFGTKTVADLSLEYGVRKFVMVSTDKAVNPTNVMGATKRIAEIYTQSLSNDSTHFITTRFGNVLGSSGSVIPIFRKQIEQGGPITLTHKDIIRYFMTIPEACNLVLEAGVMGNGGEILVFDMGKPVKIYDLAKKMIRLSGFEPEKDIKIVETGLRPGEKLFEELLTAHENTIPTHHPKILRARIQKLDKSITDQFIQEMQLLLKDGTDMDLVMKMKDFLPEYISSNSKYVKLDK